MKSYRYVKPCNLLNKLHQWVYDPEARGFFCKVCGFHTWEKEAGWWLGATERS